MNAVEDIQAMAAKVTEFAELNAHDRCDRCGAQAYVRWVKAVADLVLCGHHTGKHEPELLGSGWAIHQDNREVLTERPVAAY